MTNEQTAMLDWMLSAASTLQMDAGETEGCAATSVRVYLEPFHAAVREAPAGPAGQRSPAQMNRISASAALRDTYMARASGTISAVPRMKPRS